MTRESDQPTFPGDPPEGVDPHDYARSVKAARKMLRVAAAARGAFPDLVGVADNPGWNFALRLYIAHAEQQSLTAPDLCAHSGSWPPLGGRTIEVMLQSGMLNQHLDPDNADRTIISLTQNSLRHLHEVLLIFDQN